MVGIPENNDQKDAVDPVALAKEYRVLDECTLLQDRMDMPELYLSMDICVLPSYREGLPRCLLEAAMMGTPTVATRIRGCKEVIVDGETGLLYPPGNVRELRNLIERIAILSNNDQNKIKTIIKESIKQGDIETVKSNNLSVPLKEARENFEKEYLTTQLKKFGGNISKTAKFVGMERSALHRKLKGLGVKDLN